MLSIFPDLLIFGLFATTAIRVVVGVVLLYLGIIIIFYKRESLKERFIQNKYPLVNFIVWPLGILGMLSGIFLIIGMFTQIFGVISAYLLLNLSIIDSDDQKIFGQSWLFYIVMIIISLSLLISGPGLLGIDLPI